MLFGDKNTYATEVFHEPSTSYYMFGRICLYLGGKMLGDIGDPCNVLGVTYGSLFQAFSGIDGLEIAGKKSVQSRV